MPEREDLSGRHFGEWLVLEYAGNKKYKCQCSCGKIKEVAAQSLRNGSSTSCGHKNQEDLTGKRFGDWLVLEYAGDRSWKCQCSCGTVKNVRTYHLINGESTSCGHTNIRRNELEGKKFGEWTVLKYLGDRQYLCRCSCGVEKEVHGYSLTSGKSTSCGHNTFKNETGMVYGELTVLNYAGDGKWNCKCSCGKQVIADGKGLRSGRITSCGHARLDDITGQTFGYWTAIRHYDRTRWWCRCICGKERAVLTQALKSGTSRSCGCGGKNVAENYRNKMLEKYGDISINRRDNPRELWQIQTLSSKDNLYKYITDLSNELNRKVRITDLEKYLDTTFCNIAKIIHKFELEDYIDIYTETSAKELELLEYIKSIYNGDIKQNNRSIIKPYELDIYLPEKKLAIEFNGIYWHSELRLSRNYHINKTVMCDKLGIRLIHIFEYEWDANKEVIKNYIKNIILDNQIVYARDTVIKEIGNTDALIFINKYHIQGYASASINIALLNKNNNILGIMTFGQPRFNTNYQYELIRLVWLPGITVVGGANKLLNYFVNKYNPESIISYNNIAKFTGDIYYKLGFKFDHISEPNYVWADKNGKVIPRYKTTKQKLIKDNLGTAEESEQEIMTKLGYYRVYDCGNMVFTWSNQGE